MTFDSQIIHWATLAEFVAYLKNVPRPLWCSGATVHNTYRPDEAQWRGLASMNSMRQTYIAKGWSAGPHLYLAAECPDPADRGIWQMTPLAHQGVHAGTCNTHRIGIENVADWQARPPTPVQYGLLLDVLDLIFTRWHLEGNAVNVHKECMADRTCPGQYLSPVQLRADLTARLAAPPPPPPPAWRPYVVTAPCAVLTDRRPDAALAGGPDGGQTQLARGDVVNVGDVTGGWLWVSDGPATPPGIGFIPSAYAVPE